MGDGCDISSRWAQASVEISLRVGNQADARGSGGGVDDVLGRLGSSGATYGYLTKWSERFTGYSATLR